MIQYVYVILLILIGTYLISDSDLHSFLVCYISEL